MHILFDGKNNAYRAAYACERGKSDGRRNQYHPFVQFARQLSEIIEKFKPQAVSCIWDAPRDTVWRKAIFPLYKNRADNEYIAKLKDYLVDIEKAAKILLPELRFRVLKKDTQETDDLIYSMCRVLYPEEVVIVSSDKDFTQITYRMPNVKLYDPQEKSITPTPLIDPVVSKSLIGDTSDRIDGYHGIGPKKGAPLAECLTKRTEFLNTAGRNLYLRNQLLINLAYNPELFQNDMYVERVLAKPVRFDKKELERLSIEHKIFGVMQDYDNAFMPMQRCIDKQVTQISETPAQEPQAVPVS